MKNLNTSTNQTFKKFKKSWQLKNRTKVLRRKEQALLITPGNFRNRKNILQPLRTNNQKLSSSRLWELQTPQNTTSRKKTKNEVQAVIQARFTFNNTHLNLQMLDGKTVLKLSAGFLKNAKKSTPFANYLLGEEFGRLCKEKGFTFLHFYSEGISKNRKTLFRGLAVSGVTIMRVSLKTRLPHNGCRPPRVRRI